MKKVFITTAVIAVIIAVRMVLSVAFSEQTAVMFCRVSLTALFLYCICRLSKSKLETAR